MTWEHVFTLIREIEDTSNRRMEQGILDASVAGITNAHIAIGCKRGLQLLRDRIQSAIQMERQAELYKQQDAVKKRKSPKKAVDTRRRTSA